MSKQKYNIEHKNYAMKVMEWFYSIETQISMKLESQTIVL